MSESDHMLGCTPHGEIYSIFPMKYRKLKAIVPLKTTRIFLALTDDKAQEYTGKLLAVYGSEAYQYRLTCDTWEQAGRFLAWIEAAHE